MNPILDYQYAVDVCHERQAEGANERLIRSLASEPSAPESSWPHTAWLSQVGRATVGQAMSQLVAIKGQRNIQIAVKNAVQSAAIIFVQSNPDYAEECFDEHFLTSKALPLLQSFVVGEQAYSPAALAEVWSEQFYLSDATRRTLIAEATPIAIEFLYTLKTEVQATQHTSQRVRFTTERMQFV